MLPLSRLFMVARGLSGFDPAGSGLEDACFEFVSDEFDGRNLNPHNQRTRDVLTLSYESFWQAIVENSVSWVTPALCVWGQRSPRS